MKNKASLVFHSIVLSLFFFQLAAIEAFAQATTSDLAGVVKDPTGNTIPSATITIKNPLTNFERKVMAEQDGSYRVLGLPPNNYEITVSALGFSDFKQNFNLVLGSTSIMDVSLMVSGQNDVIIVNGTKLVETNKTAVTQNIESQKIDNLPINGRNFLGFAFINSLISRDNSPTLGPVPNTGLNFAGQRARSNSIQIDGADNIDNNTRASRSTVSQEAVQEFQVVVNSFAAEFGRTAGGVINIVTKSGNNEFHGNAFGFLRQRAIQARNALAFQPAGSNPKPAFTRGQYGFTFGGPIKKDKTFFFLSLDQTRRRESGFSAIGLDSTIFDLTPAQKAYIAANGEVGKLYQKFALAGISVAQTGIEPSTGRAIFLSTLMLSGGKLGNLTPAFRPINNVQNVYPIKEDFTFYSTRIDQELNDRHRLTLRYNFTPLTSMGLQTSGQNQPVGLNDVSRTGITFIRDTSAFVQLNSILDNSKLNEFIFNFGRRGSLFSSGTDVAINIPGVGFFGREPFSPAESKQRTFELKDTFSYSFGKHATKFGASVNFIRIDPFKFDLNFSGVFNFGDFAAGNVSPMFASAPAFSAIQAYGLGLPQNFVQGFNVVPTKVKDTQLGFYGQDSWKIRSNLVLNYGVRYDLELTPLYKPSPINTPSLSLSATQIDAAERFLNIIEGYPRDKNNIAPRIGIAWDPKNDGKTVIRVSSGLFYGNPVLFVGADADIIDGVQIPQLIASVGNALPTSSLNASQIFQGTVVVGTTPGVDPGTVFLPNESRFDPKVRFPGYGALLPISLPVDRNYRLPYTIQANFTIERELSSTTALQISYIFTGGRKLPHSVNRNAPDGKRVLAASGPDRIANNFFRPSGPNPVFVKTNLPIPFGNVGTQESSSSSIYHGLSLNLTKRFSPNMQLQVSYSYSKTIDDATDLQTLLQPQDNRNPGLERSLSLLDQKHKFVLSAVLKTPFKQNSSGIKKLLAETTFAPIIELSAGRPFNILTGADTNLDQSSVTDRPNVNITNGALSLPGAAQTGTLGRNPGITPGFASVDFRLSKNIPLGEKVKIEIISEAFNLLNRVNVSMVNNNFRTVTFKESRFRSPATAVFDPRQFQFSLKVKF